MSNLHTPGPWVVDETVALGAYGVWTAYPHPQNPGHDGAGYQVQVCAMTCGEWVGKDAIIGKAERNANARLIAAAPEMLAELRETAAWLDDRANVLVQLLADPKGWGRGQTVTDKRQAIREEIARLQGRAFLIRQVIDKATNGA